MLQCTNKLLHSAKPSIVQPLTNSPQRIITRTIWMLSLVSLFTDLASEMLYPVMPLFLKHIGYSAIFIGVLEGIAEAVAGLSKSYFGKWSDLSGKRLPFVQLGYAFSAISKPMLAILTYPWWIFLSRTVDRLGKGIRTGARDAMLSDECTKENKGRVFGFHRSMDTFGAVLGPVAALTYLYFYPDDYKTLFLIAFIPGLLAIITTLLIKEKRRPATTNHKSQTTNFFTFFSYWKTSSPEYKRLLTGLLLFALFNSSDVFLLLRMKESGLPDTAIIGTYVFYNLVYALLAYPVGILADRIGLKRIFITGLFVFAFVYLGFALNNNSIVFIFLFLLYGLYAAATEGVSKAWISNIVDKSETATAIGTYSGFQSICALIASSLCGLLWYNFGSMVTFLVTVVMTVVVIIYLSLFKRTDSADS
ncbi:MAG: MFS transporter [Chitinophagaceae bacterium]|nr:MFS transporter [Chitinophagaceae bacterium]